MYIVETNYGNLLCKKCEKTSGSFFNVTDALQLSAAFPIEEIAQKVSKIMEIIDYLDIYPTMIIDEPLKILEI